MKKPNLNGSENGIDETQPELKNNEWIVIGDKKRWIRTCPKCNKNIYYKNKGDVNRSSHKLCKTCCKLGEKNGMFNRGDIISGKKHHMFGKHHSKNTKNKISNGNKLYKKLYPDLNPSKLLHVKLKKSLKMRGKNNPMYGKFGIQNPMYGKHFNHSKETKLKMRISRIRDIINKNGCCFPNFNKKSCIFFESLEIQNN